MSEETTLEVNPNAPGVRILLMGESGSGKTHVLRTLAERKDITDVFVVFTEPGMEVIGDMLHDNPNGPNFHWTYVKPTALGTDTLLAKVEKMSSMTWDGMQKQTTDPDKKKYDAGVRLLRALNSPVCDTCGATFDDVSTWGNDKVIVLDSLSGLNQAAMQLVAGGAIAKSQPQWGAAMDTELQIINQLCYDTNAHFIMTAHLDKLPDPINGGQIIRVNALGNKNAPEIPKNFSDVLLAYREQGKFYWSSQSPQVETKTRNTRLASNITQDLSPLIDNWRKHHVKQ